MLLVMFKGIAKTRMTEDTKREKNMIVTNDTNDATNENGEVATDETNNTSIRRWKRIVMRDADGNEQMFVSTSAATNYVLAHGLAGDGAKKSTVYAAIRLAALHGNEKYGCYWSCLDWSDDYVAKHSTKNTDKSHETHHGIGVEMRGVDDTGDARHFNSVTEACAYLEENDKVTDGVSTFTVRQHIMMAAASGTPAYGYVWEIPTMPVGTREKYAAQVARREERRASIEARRAVIEARRASRVVTSTDADGNVEKFASSSDASRHMIAAGLTSASEISVRTHINKAAITGGHAYGRTWTSAKWTDDELAEKREALRERMERYQKAHHNVCLKCGKPISNTAAYCASCAQQERWAREGYKLVANDALVAEVASDGVNVVAERHGVSEMTVYHSLRRGGYPYKMASLREYVRLVTSGADDEALADARKRLYERDVTKRTSRGSGIEVNEDLMREIAASSIAMTARNHSVSNMSLLKALDKAGYPFHTASITKYVWQLDHPTSDVTADDVRSQLYEQDVNGRKNRMRRNKVEATD